MEWKGKKKKPKNLKQSNKIWTKSSFFVLRLQNQIAGQFFGVWSLLASVVAGFEPSVTRKLSEYSKATTYQCQSDRPSRAGETTLASALFLLFGFCNVYIMSPPAVFT